jgi:FkbM family methyltransferase
MNRQHKALQILLRLWPFPRGAGRIIDYCFSKIAFDDDIVTVRTTDGFDMNIMPNDLIGRHIYLTGEFDRSTAELLFNFAAPGDTLLDIGANIGYVSACFLKNVPNSKVIAVEPQPAVLDLLRDNLGRFGPDRHQVVPVAVSDRNDDGWLEICALNKGASRLTTQSNGLTTRVEMWSADRLFSRLNLDKVDLIKLDVEGHEDVVLRASRAALQRLKPRAIVFEDHACKAAPNGSIGVLMRMLGYRILGVRKRLMTLDLIPILTEEDCRFNDYIAVL